MKQTLIKFLPLLIILFSIVGAASWYLQNKKTQEEIKPEIVNPSDLESDNLVISPTPTTSFFFSDQTKLDSIEPTTLPQTEEPKEESDQELDSSNQDQAVATTTTTTTICTPVYGMADTCTEHVVVDTGAESSIAYSLSAFSYLAGLVAFVKSKRD
jgi:hypothetical protein